MQPFRGRSFVTFHDAFSYLAQRYDLKQVAIAAVPETSLTPSDIQETIEVVKSMSIAALFSEPGVENKLLQALSTDLNLPLRSLDPLEAGELAPGYYFTVMEQNLETLQDSFQ